MCAFHNQHTQTQSNARTHGHTYVHALKLSSYRLNALVCLVCLVCQTAYEFSAANESKSLFSCALHASPLRLSLSHTVRVCVVLFVEAGVLVNGLECALMHWKVLVFGIQNFSAARFSCTLMSSSKRVKAKITMNLNFSRRSMWLLLVMVLVGNFYPLLEVDGLSNVI